MKKILLNISLALALGFTISSCNDWLDGVKQTSTVSDEIVWQDEAYVGECFLYISEQIWSVR